MTNLIEKRKAELREYIEARARATQNTWYNSNATIIVKTPKISEVAEFYTGDESLDNCGENADFICKAANESARIAEQLLECIEALCEISKEFGTDYADGNTILAKEVLDKIAGEK